MSLIIKAILKHLGPAWLLKKAYEAVRPYLLKWAQDDNEHDWDDVLVEVMDKIIEAIVGRLEK